MKSDSAALVLFSGGQDSTVCLAYALDRYPRVETVGFDYGQRHGVEMQCRQAVRSEIGHAFPAWAARLGPDHVLDIASFGATADTARCVFRRGLHALVGGMCEAYYSGYPDCRDATLREMEQAIRLGTEIPFTIETPLMWLSKAKTWELAEKLGGEIL